MSKNDRNCRSSSKLYAHGRLAERGDGGGRRDRTDDLLLAKQALSQLSYAPGIRRGRDPGVVRPARTGLTLRKSRSRESWWAREDLNLRPHAYQARALTS